MAMFRSQAVADNYGSFGYLVSIAALLSFANLPRARFFEGLLRNILGACLACPVSIFGLWCSREAKNNTGGPTSPTNPYNASAAAVCAVFLFFNVLFASAFRAVWCSIMGITMLAKSKIDDDNCPILYSDQCCIHTRIPTSQYSACILVS
jgi:hypothetical protein